MLFKRALKVFKNCSFSKLTKLHGHFHLTDADFFFNGEKKKNTLYFQVESKIDHAYTLRVSRIARYFSPLMDS